MSLKLNAKQLRGSEVLPDPALLEHNDIYIILDDVLDTYNIGSIFRLADAVAAKKIYLCAGSATPPNHRILKASVNTTGWVDWEYCETVKDAISKVKRQNSKVKIVAVEQSATSVAYDKFDYQLPIALVVGNESVGMSKEVIDLCDGVVELPMYGVNVSLNVMVSLGIVMYEVLEKATAQLGH